LPPIKDLRKKRARRRIRDVANFYKKRRKGRKTKKVGNVKSLTLGLARKNEISD